MLNNQTANSDITHPATSSLASEISRLVTTLQTLAISTDNPAPATTRRAVRAREAMLIIGLKRSNFYARQNARDHAWDPTFPKSFKLGDSPRSPTVWFVDELESWLETHAIKHRKQ